MAQFDEIPLAKGLPVLGNALQLTAKDFHRQLYALSEEYGTGLFRVEAPGGKRHVVVVTNPKLLKEVFDGDFITVTKPPSLYKTFALLCSTSEPPTFPVLATDDRDKWQGIRGGFAAAFAQQAVPQYIPLLTDEVHKVLDQLASPAQLDVLELVGRISLSSTGKIMFGYNFDCTDLGRAPTFWRAIITARMGAVDAARNPIIGLEQRLCPFLPGPKEFASNLEAVHKTLDEIYSEMEAAASAAAADGAPGRASGPPTIREAFQTTRDPANPGQLLSKVDTIATIGNLVVAGTLPAATAIAYTLCLVACSPAVQGKVHQELDALGLAGRPFEASDVPRLTYLANVIKEAMRVNPTVAQVNRQAARDFVLGGYQIPEGTLLFLSFGGMLTSPLNFTEPHRFWPERWEEAAAAGSGDPQHPRASRAGNLDDIDGSYTPFSSGPRACLGQHWARLAILGTVASVLAKFKLTAPEDMTVEQLAADEVFSISTYPHHPLRLTFTPRA